MSAELVPHADEALELVADGAVNVPGACDFTGLSRTALYEELRSGRIRSFKVNRRRLIPRGEVPDSALDKLLETKAKAEAILAGEKFVAHESRMADQELRPHLEEVQDRLAVALDNEARSKALELLQTFHEWRDELLKPLGRVEGLRASNGSAFLDYVMNETTVLKNIERVLNGLEV